MKIKLQFVEGYHITAWKQPIEIETDDYPELKDLTKEEAIKYIKNNSEDMPFVEDGKPLNDWNLYEELMGQETELEKEKNYGWDIEEA
jgi:hypothetical protein